MSNDHKAHARLILTFFSEPRIAGYLTACSGDPVSALRLYRWNTKLAAAMWETLSHLEIALRNTMAQRMRSRHIAADRPGSWLDDPAGELDARARRDITIARDRLRIKRVPLTEARILAELSFGFWRYLLARRYTELWPDLAAGFPNAPTRDRQLIERRVTRLHQLRNRLAHHERVWNQPIAAHHDDIRTLLTYINTDLAAWCASACGVPGLLRSRPVELPGFPSPGEVDGDLDVIRGLA